MPAKSSLTTMPPKLRLKLANECQNVVERAKLNAPNKSFRFHVLQSNQLNDCTFNKMMILFESLMREMYEKTSWGWNESDKMAEWKHARTRVILVTKNDNCDIAKNLYHGELPEDNEPLVGFMCFRFETGADKSECSLYVYELHVDPEYQRQGLGEELMRMARVLASQFKMDKIMLTVFRSNSPALQFYDKLKFATDKSSPAKNEADYTILSSKIK